MARRYNVLAIGIPIAMAILSMLLGRIFEYRAKAVPAPVAVGGPQGQVPAQQLKQALQIALKADLENKGIVLPAGVLATSVRNELDGRRYWGKQVLDEGDKPLADIVRFVEPEGSIDVRLTCQVPVELTIEGRLPWVVEDYDTGQTFARTHTYPVGKHRLKIRKSGDGKP